MYYYLSACNTKYIIKYRMPFIILRLDIKLDFCDLVLLP